MACIFSLMAPSISIFTGLRSRFAITPGQEAPQRSGGVRRLIRWLAASFLLGWACLLVYHQVKPLPDGISALGPARSASDVSFLYDLTFQRDGRTEVEQEIFHRVFSLVDEAQEFVIVDMFLFNGEHGGERDYAPLARELTDRLARRRSAIPELRAVFITDEINTFYGAYPSEDLQRLEAAGVQVVVTRSSPPRVSNPVFSAAWRFLFGWMGTGGPGWLPHPLSSSGRRVTARSYLKLLNFKANHRKLLITDGGCLVTSANPHDASSLHSNIAFQSRGAICADLLESEKAVVSFSGESLQDWPKYEEASPGESPPSATNRGSVRLATEGKIREALLKDLATMGPGDRIDLAMFYLSSRDVMEGLLQAAGRGASLRLILDPNKDAFGREKGGIPNRQVAGELVSRSEGRVQVRWFDTHGEQFHTKLAVLTRRDSVLVMGGSANLTRRNIGDFNLETDLRLGLAPDSPLAEDIGAYFERIFLNQGGEFTLPFQAYADGSRWKRALYRVQELTGFSSF